MSRLPSLRNGTDHGSWFHRPRREEVLEEGDEIKVVDIAVEGIKGHDSTIVEVWDQNQLFRKDPGGG